MRSSSERPLPSPLKTSGWFGTIRSSTATVPVARAIWMVVSSAPPGGSGRLRPPEMKRKAVLEAGFSGLTTLTQCCQTGWSTSFSVRQVWDLRSTMYCVTPSPWTSFATLKE